MTETTLFTVELRRAPPLYADQVLEITQDDHRWDGRSLRFTLKVQGDAVMAACHIALDKIDDVRRLRAALDRYLEWPVDADGHPVAALDMHAERSPAR